MQPSKNFELWKRLAQEEYPSASDESLRNMWSIGSSDWLLSRNTNVAKLFEQYVMLKKLMYPDQGEQDGN